MVKSALPVVMIMTLVMGTVCRSASRTANLLGVAVPPPPPAQPVASRTAPPGQPAPLTIARDLEYARVDDHTLRLDLYFRDTADKAPRPVVVWVPGDAGLNANKSPTPAARLVANGYAVASVDYRPAVSGTFPAQLHDVKAAVRWLRANAAKYNLDADHIGVWGEGSGGTLAALLGTTGEVRTLEGNEGVSDQSSRVQAVVDFFGPMDQRRTHPVATGVRPDDSTSTETINPITYASAGDPPFLIVQGTADQNVPVQQSETLQFALMRAGVDNDLEFVIGAGHHMEEVETPAIADRVTDFFDRHLRGGRQQRDDLDKIREPADAWIDAFPDDLPGLQSKLYATPSRGADTQASYRLYLPPGYDIPANSARRFPVIYFLHGFGDDSREASLSGYVARMDAAIRSGLMPPAIVVVVQSPNQASFEDSAGIPAESVFIKDLIPAIDKAYRTVASREGRAIDGHSMGGSGSLRLGFKYPDLFGTVCAISPAMTSPGSSGIVLNDAESPWRFAVQNADRVRGRTHIQIIEGDDDGGERGGLLRIQWMSAVLDRVNLAHNFILSPGAKHPVKDELSRLENSPFVFYAKAFAR